MKLKVIWEKVKDIFSLHCPECNGRMKSEFLDMEIDTLVYKCEKCGHRYIPTYARVFFSMHFGRTRYMKCPKCGKRSWNKKVLTKE